MTSNRAWIAGLLALAGVGAFALRVAFDERVPTARCPAGSVASAARCCPIGQRHDSTGHCVGSASSCPHGLMLHASGKCWAESRRVRIAGGALRLGPIDWEAQGRVATRDLELGAFYLDSHEVTEQRWHSCAEAGSCRARFLAEPGQPARGISARDAARFCVFAGGRLPRAEEWIFAAATSAGNRYPWGATGLVCRRASFGLVMGPCAFGASQPELAGMRPDGRSKTGLFDLVGNVAEWVSSPSGAFQTAGGSFRSRVATELKSFALSEPSGEGGDVGFRCAYDRPE
jgi:formylglycine-generating enzyme required for sulfatase activity